MRPLPEELPVLAPAIYEGCRSVKPRHPCIATTILDRDQPQAFTVPALTPLHTSSLVIQPASITTFRLSWVIGTGVRNTECIGTFLGPPSNTTEPVTASILVPLASCTATSPAALPSARASFQTDTVWVPSATRFSAAWSPSWPET